MGHFNRLITIMSKDRKARKAQTARARVSGPGFGPEKLEPDPDRGISTKHAHCAEASDEMDRCPGYNIPCYLWYNDKHVFVWMVLASMNGLASKVEKCKFASGISCK